MSNPIHIFKPRPDTEWGLYNPEEVPINLMDGDLEDIFPTIPLGLNSPPCHWLENWVRDEPGAPVLFLVHGIDGDDSPEWLRLLPELQKLNPATMFWFRWSPYEKRDVLAEALAMGVSRVAECLQERSHPMVVLAHSAGGVLATYAASRIMVPRFKENDPITVVTVASPLSGYGTHVAREDGGSEYTYLLDLGTTILSYPRAAPGVRVAHFRTWYPADRTMGPGAGGHLPNRPDVGSPDARHVALPKTWGHVSSLMKVVAAMVDGRWVPWRNFEAAEALGGGEALPTLEVDTVCQLRADIEASGDIFESIDFDQPPDLSRVRMWDGSSLPETPPSPDTYIRCRPCDCQGKRLTPWASWESVNAQAYAHLRSQRAPYPVVIVPGFYSQSIMHRRLADALELVRLGWAASVMVSGGHQSIGYSTSRWMLDAIYRMARENHDLDLRNRVFIEPCATETLTHLRNGLRMMAAMHLPHGLFLVDSKMSMQSHVLFSQLDERVPRELQCPVGRVSYLYGDGPRPRLGANATGCHPTFSWRSNPFGYMLSSRRPAVFWVSPNSTYRGRSRSALDCFGGSAEVSASEPDNQDPWLSTCLPAMGQSTLACSAEDAPQP